MTAQKELHDTFELVGKTLDGQYRVDRVIGEGGFGVVYKGRHISLEQPIAIKALKVMDCDDPVIQQALLAKFKDEAKLLYTLSQQSLNIVRSMDFGSVSAPNGLWAPYMVLEWLDGRSLAEDLDDRRRRGMKGRTPDETIALLASAAEGLALAHERRVAHRDVKPANLFIVPEAKGPHVKVLDFGIAKVLRDDDGAGGTKSKFASFTWAYAAPEQLDPRVGQQGLATDVYAFALVLTEVLTDRPPIDTRDVVGMLKAATDPTIRPTPRQRGANVPDWLETVCRRALAVDPKGRYPSLGEFWHALTLAQGKRISNNPPTPQTPATKPSAGAQPPTAMQAPVAAALAPPPQRAPTPPPYAPPPPPQYGMPPAFRPSAPLRGVGPPAAGPQAAPMVPYGQPPPQQTGWMQTRPRMLPTKDNTVTVAVILVAIGVLFAAACGIAHAACS